MTNLCSCFLAQAKEQGKREVEKKNPQQTTKGKVEKLLKISIVKDTPKSENDTEYLLLFIQSVLSIWVKRMTAVSLSDMREEKKPPLTKSLYMTAHT